MAKSWNDRKWRGKPSSSKYRNVKVQTSEGRWDSQREYNRHCELRMLEEAGEISALREQVRYELIPAQREQGELITKGPNAGRRKCGKVAERAVIYVADFVYTDKDGNTVVEDAKGKRTKEYVIKRKLMRYIHGIVIAEV